MSMYSQNKFMTIKTCFVLFGYAIYAFFGLVSLDFPLWSADGSELSQQSNVSLYLSTASMASRSTVSRATCIKFGDGIGGVAPVSLA